jgi:preprotein translocase subunit SecA
MTGTAMTEQEELYKIYGLEVVSVPTHRPMIRDDDPDLVFRNENAKFEALIDEVEEMTEAGRPVLVGTVSVEKSEVLSEMLNRRGIRHEVLNAKYHDKEAPIVAQAGRLKAVTIATNMAGRGTDIMLGGNPQGLASSMLHAQGINPAEAEPEVYDAALATAKAQTAEEHEQVVAAGGLHIIGTERHDARRIDNQLRGRAGRQGDPGSSRFYLSLEDTLMKRFASDRVAGLMERMGLEGDVAIESRLVSKTIENAQSRVEGYNFDIRKRVVEYDDVINKQRETIYAERDKVLRNEDLTETVRDFIQAELDVHAEVHLGPVVDEWDIEGLARAVLAMGIERADIDAEGLAGQGSREGIIEALSDAADAQLEAREQEHSADVWAMVERLVLLRTIDSLWVDHLTELDDFRRGVGLRGYGGTDPLNEFKREAFQLYEELRGFIRHQVASTIFRVSVQRQEPPPPQQMRMPSPAELAQIRAASASTNGDGGNGTSWDGAATPVTAGSSAASTAERAASVRATSGTGTVAAGTTGALLPGLGSRRPSQVRLQRGDEAVEGSQAPAHAAKLGRNDPCWCGSGQKFKKCHGR